MRDEKDYFYPTLISSISNSSFFHTSIFTTLWPFSLSSSSSSSFSFFYPYSISVPHVSLSHYLSLYLSLSLSVSSPSLDCLPACLSFSLSIPLSISLYLPLCHTHYFFLSSLTFMINSPSNSCLVDSTSTPLKATSLLRSSSCV